MKGDAKVIAILNEVLKAELTAINQYFLHAEMCENWGYERMAKQIRKESIEEMQHAEILMERILYLDGAPNMTDYFKINVGQTLKAQLENDLQLEYTAVKRLNEGIKAAVAVGDNGSRELMKRSCWTKSITSIIWKDNCTSSRRSGWTIIWRSRFIRAARFRPSGFVVEWRFTGR